MTTNFIKFIKSDVIKDSAIERFNQDMKSNGFVYELPLNSDKKNYPKELGKDIVETHYILKNKSKVIGGVSLKQQKFLINQNMKNIACYRNPVSLGILDKKYAFVGVRLIQESINKNPLLFSLGIGGYDVPLAKLLKTLGWKISKIPFLFMVINWNRFFKHIKYKKNNFLYRFLFKIVQVFGLAYVMTFISNIINNYRFYYSSREYSYEHVSVFDNSIDHIWENNKSLYDMISVKTSKQLNDLYSPIFLETLHRLIIKENNKIVGWAVVMNSDLNDHRYFGDMRLGTIVDCLATSGKEKQIIIQASKYLLDSDVDLIVTNQSYSKWIDSCKNVGFFEGFSNFLLALSPKLRQLKKDNLNIHILRGDGDGPINLS